MCCVSSLGGGEKRGESNPKFYIIRKRLSSASRRCPCRDTTPFLSFIHFSRDKEVAHEKCSHEKKEVVTREVFTERERSASTLHTHTHYAQLGHVQITIDPIVVLFFFVSGGEERVETLHLSNSFYQIYFKQYLVANVRYFIQHNEKPLSTTSGQ